MNPYQKTITDEVTGLEFVNDKYKAWNEGYSDGIKEVVEWSNEPCILHGDSDKRIREGKFLRQGNCYECWQAKPKEWRL